MIKKITIVTMTNLCTEGRFYIMQKTTGIIKHAQPSIPHTL